MRLTYRQLVGIQYYSLPSTPTPQSDVLQLETEISQIFLWRVCAAVSPKPSALNLVNMFPVNYTMTSRSILLRHKKLTPIVYSFFILGFIYFASRRKINNYHVAGGTREYPILVSKICNIHDSTSLKSRIANLGHSDGIPSSLPQCGDRLYWPSAG